MNVPLSSSSDRTVRKYRRIHWLLPLLLASVSQLCWADSTPPPPSSPAAVSDQKAISSIIDRASLGDCADIQVPQGYRFLGPEDARALLERMNNPVAPGVLGVLAPADGKWLAVLEFQQVGYVRNVDEKKADFGAILKAVQNRRENEDSAQSDAGIARVASVDWEIQPEYDASAHSLEWAFRADTPTGKVVNHTVALLGRRGVLDITVVQPYQSSKGSADLVPVKELAKKISFREEQRYTDYQKGDRIASVGLQQLIVGEEQNSGSQHELAAASSVSGVVMWIYSGIGGCVVAGIALLAYKKVKKPTIAPTAAANGHSLPAIQTNGTNGKRNGKINGTRHNGAGRKVFNYSKFYSDMVLQLSGSTYGWVTPGNGNSRPRTAEPAAPIPAAANPAPAPSNLELIACQKNLIEEQRNLMREQTRIIEEKAKLIKEYTQLVERLSQDVENQFSLKLD